MPRRKKAPEIDPAEIARLRELVEEEEVELEHELKREVRQVMVQRDKKMLRELRRLELKNRRLIMWIGVIFLMLVIVSFWVSRLDTIIINPLKNLEAINNPDISNAREELSKTMDEVLKGIEEIKTKAKEVEQAGAPLAAEKLPPAR